jgi:hypothetical protein
MATRSLTSRPRGGALKLGLLALVVGPWVAAGCANFQGTTAASFMKTLQTSDDPNSRYHAYSKLGSPNCYDAPAQRTQAVKLMVASLESGKEPIATRAMICRSLGSLAHPDGREALLGAVTDPDGVVRTEACRALGRVAQPEDATVFVRVMAVETMEDCRIAAIEAIGEMKAKDPRVQSMLVTALEDDDPAIRLASLNSLRAIAGKDHGMLATDWTTALNLPITSPAKPDPAAAVVEAPTLPQPTPEDTQTKPATFPGLPPIP